MRRDRGDREFRGFLLGLGGFECLLLGFQLVGGSGMRGREERGWKFGSLSWMVGLGRVLWTGFAGTHQGLLGLAKME